MVQADLTEGFRIGDTVKIKTGNAYRYYQIAKRDTLFYVKTNHSAVTAGTTALSYTKMDDLNPPDNYLFQIYRIELVKGNVQAFLNQPSSTNRWGTNVAPTSGFLTDDHNTAEVEIYITKNNHPSIAFKNLTNASQTPVTRWDGFSYELKPLTEAETKGKPFIEIATEGI